MNNSAAHGQSEGRGPTFISSRQMISWQVGLHGEEIKASNKAEWLLGSGPGTDAN